MSKQVRYNANHLRVHRKRGPASAHQCCICRERDAHDWAQVHGTSGEDPANYAPMCRSCHMQYDLSKEVCDNGHAQTPENLRWQKDRTRVNGGRLRCRPCSLARSRRAAKKRRENKRTSPERPA